MADGDDGMMAQPRPRRSLKEKADAAAESSWTRLSARLAMIMTGPLLAIVAWLALDKLDHFDRRLDQVATDVREQGDALNQIALNEARAKDERDNLGARVKELWDRVFLRK